MLYKSAEAFAVNLFYTNLKSSLCIPHLYVCTPYSICFCNVRASFQSRSASAEHQLAQHHHASTPHRSRLLQHVLASTISDTNAVRMSTFWYSTNGKDFKQLGPAFDMSNTWQSFTGHRFGACNHATKALGGETLAKSFQIELS